MSVPDKDMVSNWGEDSLMDSLSKHTHTTTKPCIMPMSIKLEDFCV